VSPYRPLGSFDRFGSRSLGVRLKKVASLPRASMSLWPGPFSRKARRARPVILRADRTKRLRGMAYPGG
jgi:hypothetical protein